MFEDVEETLSVSWPPRVYWLLSRHGRSHEIFLILETGSGADIGGSKALPVFSDEHYAARFLDAGALDRGAWRVRGMAGGELISLLCGPCGKVAGVSLNPQPSIAAGGRLRIDLERGAFLDVLSQRSHVREGCGGLRAASVSEALAGSWGS